MAGSVYTWLLLGLLAIAPSVRAQSRQVSLDASARAFFNQGVELADEGKTEEAADRFRRAMAIRYSPVIAFNLASMLESQGQLVEACELLYRVENDSDADQVLRASAQRMRGEIEPRIAHLTVTVDASVTDGAVMLDDVKLIPAQLGAPIPIDPTSHQVQLLRSDAVVERHAFELAPAAEEFVHLGAPIVLTPQQVAAATQLTPPPVEKDSSRETQGGLLQSPWLWAGVGVVVVGVVVLSGQCPPDE